MNGALMGEQLDQGCVDGGERIEEPREPGALDLGSEPKEVAVAVDAPARAGSDDLETGLAAAEAAGVGAASGVFVGEREVFGVGPPGLGDMEWAAEVDAGDLSAEGEGFQAGGAEEVRGGCRRRHTGVAQRCWALGRLLCRFPHVLGMCYSCCLRSPRTRPDWSPPRRSTLRIPNRMRRF